MWSGNDVKKKIRQIIKLFCGFFLVFSVFFPCRHGKNMEKLLRLVRHQNAIIDFYGIFFPGVFVSCLMYSSL